MTSTPHQSPVVRLETGPPDFVGMGAMKAGTTWLHTRLVAHPEIHDLAQKELHYFDWYFDREFGDDEISRYHQRFARPEGMLVGEFTPRYMFDVATAPLLARAAPDARLIVLLRDPVTRIESHLRWEPTGQKMLPMFKSADAVGRCLYHSQLTHILSSFPREQVLVLQYERIALEPAAVYRRALAHIGVRDLDHLPENLAEPVLRSQPRSTGLPSHSRRAVVQFLAPEIRRLAADFDAEIDLELWPDFVDLS
jgi:hypothetical protein